MDNLEKYIKSDKDAFDDKELPAGHLERFESRLDRLASSREVSRPRPVLWALVGGIAAAVAAVILISRPDNYHGDWFAGVGNDQVEICETYYSNVADNYADLYAGGADAELGLLAESVVDETSPLLDQLPVELGDDERAEILKEYYGELLDALVKIKNIK